MLLHLNSDAVALIALIVSLVALLAALLQVIQQYAATAYDYRRCSRRTMGGWAKHTKRLFIPSEIRFEITIAVPHIELDFNIRTTLRQGEYRVVENEFSEFPGYEQSHLIAESVESIRPYFGSIFETGKKFLRSIGPQSKDVAKDSRLRKDWFLSLSGAVPEAACSWLRFLNDTQSTNMDYAITTKRLSFDYLPRDVTRPFASADLPAFLATLTLFGIEWKDRGADGIFVGRSLQNGIVVTATNIPSVGTVYSYDRAFRLPLPAESKLHNKGPFFFTYNCMFNRFRLINSYGDILTWSKDEIRQSLTTVLDDAQLADRFSQQYKLNELNIGIGELIAGWSHVVSMPRRGLYGGTQSCFSSSSLGCTFGMPLLSSILRNKEGMVAQHGLDKEDSALMFVEMIEGYYAFLKTELNYGQDWFDRLFKCLEWASRLPTRSNILFFYRPFDTPDLEECYNLMAEEKQGLDSVVMNLEGQDDKPLLKIGTALLRAYTKKDPMFMQQGPITENAESWIREAVLLTTTAAVDALEELSQHDRTKREFWRNLIINRILRGVLWTIHNGNAPGWDSLAKKEDQRHTRDRSLECSLSSKWFNSGEIMYIS